MKDYITKIVDKSFEGNKNSFLYNNYIFTFKIFCMSMYLYVGVCKPCVCR